MKPHDNNSLAHTAWNRKYHICAEVLEKNLLQRKQSGNRENAERIMQLETGENCRGRNMP